MAGGRPRGRGPHLGPGPGAGDGAGAGWCGDRPGGRAHRGRLSPSRTRHSVPVEDEEPRHQVGQGLQGSVVPAVGFGWEISQDSVNRLAPSVGGITLNFKVGDLVDRYVADHLEPGVSTNTEPNPTANRKNPRNKGYNMYSCIGNDAEVLGGRANRARGRVTGHHGGVEHVLIDFSDAALSKLTYDDKIIIYARGQGLKLSDYPDILLYNLDPTLLKKMKIKPGKAKLQVPVTTVVPAACMGSGVGASHVARGDYDIVTSDPETVQEYQLDKIRFGDFVALLDHDNRYGRAYRKGAVTIGVIVHSDCRTAGHGPGVTTIMTCATSLIKPVIDPQANVADLLDIGSKAKKK